MRYIQTLNQLHSLQSETYVYAVIVAFVIFVVAFLLAKCIPFQAGNDLSYVKRRIGLISCIVVGSLGFWLYNNLYVMNHISEVAFRNQFSSTNNICLLITFLGSGIVSLVVMLRFRHSKFGSILGKMKNA